MKAIVVEQAGGPEVLKIKEIPTPEPRPGWVLIKEKAFGLNRAELYTRLGHSGPAVKFPRVLGIECVGQVEAAPDGDFQPGQTVAAVLGGMGRSFDGSYAEYTLVPASQVMPVKTDLPWDTLAAIPETFLTAWHSLVTAMAVQAGESLLVRGATSSVGMAAITLAKDMGLTVIGTTRNKAKTQALLDGGADHVIIDTGQIADEVKKIFPEGVNQIVELVGTVTLLDSLQAAAPHGTVCNTGILGDAWSMDDFQPLVAIPSTVKLTAYSTGAILTAANSGKALQGIVEGVEQGRYRVNLDKAYSFDQIVEAHRYMEESRATGKLVVTV